MIEAEKKDQYVVVSLGAGEVSLRTEAVGSTKKGDPILDLCLRVDMPHAGVSVRVTGEKNVADVISTLRAFFAALDTRGK